MPLYGGFFKGFAALFAVQRLNTSLALSALVKYRQRTQTGRRYSGRGECRSQAADRRGMDGGSLSGGASVVVDLSTHAATVARSEEHTSELQSRVDLVCRLLLEKKKKNNAA